MDAHDNIVHVGHQLKLCVCFFLCFYFFYSDFNITMSLIREKSTIAHEASDVDKIGAAKAIVRLWYTYKLDLASLFRYY